MKIVAEIKETRGGGYSLAAITAAKKPLNIHTLHLSFQ